MSEGDTKYGLNPSFDLSKSMAKSEPTSIPVLEAANKLSEQIFIDSLTGVYNQKAWEDFKNHSDYIRGDKTTIVMVDLNGLKDINDKKGHMAGDEYLKNTAKYLTDVFSRTGDRVFRIGGDEFIIACDFIEPEKRDEFNSFTSSYLNHDFLTEKGLDFSFGIAHTDPQEDVSIEDTLKRADERMYKNKEEIKTANPEKYTR